MPKFFYGILIAIIAVVILFFVFNPLDSSAPSTEDTGTETESDSEKPDYPTLILDAGHGGFDPGKVGINGALEKDLNLAIVLKLQKLLEEKGFTVHLTRDSDTLLGPANSTSKKKDDMITRVDMVKEIDPFFTISIHQNSFTNEKVSGPQVFYYKESMESATMAQVIQDALNTYLEPEKDRVAQSNTNYYLLTRTPTPTVIVECGFLSNPTEADLLVTEEYQTKVAEAVFFGIVSYYETVTSTPQPTE